MNKLAAEFIGTYALVFAGTGAVVADEFSGGAVGHVGVALSFGLVVMGMIYAIGDVSGAHINPAVTVGFWAAGRFAGKLVAPYVLAQCLGALAASASLRLLFPDVSTLGATLPKAGVWQTFVIEVLLTAGLFYVILGAVSGSKEKGLLAGIAIGGTVALEALFAGPFTGALMNPARSLGPAVVGGQVEHLWIYVAAPVLGALAAIVAFKLTHVESES